jgi:hypothetical protein
MQAMIMRDEITGWRGLGCGTTQYQRQVGMADIVRSSWASISPAHTLAVPIAPASSNAIWSAAKARGYRNSPIAWRHLWRRSEGRARRSLALELIERRIRLEVNYNEDHLANSPDRHRTARPSDLRARTPVHKRSRMRARRHQRTRPRKAVVRRTLPVLPLWQATALARGVRNTARAHPRMVVGSMTIRCVRTMV